MEKSLSARKTTRNDPWPLLTEQDIDAAQQLIQLSSTDSSSSCNSADSVDDCSTAIKRTAKQRGEEEGHGYTADDVSCLVVTNNSMNVRKRKFRAVEELYRATRPIKLFRNSQN